MDPLGKCPARGSLPTIQRSARRLEVPPLLLLESLRRPDDGLGEHKHVYIDWHTYTCLLYIRIYICHVLLIVFSIGGPIYRFHAYRALHFRVRPLSSQCLRSPVPAATTHSKRRSKTKSNSDGTPDSNSNTNSKNNTSRSLVAATKVVVLT